MIPVDKPADTRPTRQQCSVAVDPIGWRLVLGELVTHVPVDTLDAAVRAAAAAAAATGADGAGHLRVDLTDRRVVLGLQDRATAAVTALDLGLARRISAALDAIDLPTTPGEGTAAPQTIEIAIDALDIPAVRPFWRAVTGYAADPQPPDLPPGALVDPLHRGPVIWFQQMDRPATSTATGSTSTSTSRPNTPGPASTRPWPPAAGWCPQRRRRRSGCSPTPKATRCASAPGRAGTRLIARDHPYVRAVPANPA